MFNRVEQFLKCKLIKIYFLLEGVGGVIKTKNIKYHQKIH